MIMNPFVLLMIWTRVHTCESRADEDSHQSGVEGGKVIQATSEYRHVACIFTFFTATPGKQSEKHPTLLIEVIAKL